MALRDILVCPVCHATLRGCACAACGREYAETAGVLDLTPVPPPDDEVRGRWPLWEALQANGERAYRTDPPSSLSVGERADARAFAAFAQLDGLVLDVGCGPQALPSYADAMAGELVGIDPLAGEQPRGFAFVKGIAEYLPFADQTFDRVLFATSIDHVLSPKLAVADARRVAKAGGEVVVWLGEPAPAPPLRARLAEAARMLRRGELTAVAAAARAALRRADPEQAVTVSTPGATMTFDVPSGAIDAFHVDHPDSATVCGWLRDAGLAVVESARPLPGHCFIRARR